jgi:hypothetical protein
MKQRRKARRGEKWSHNGCKLILNVWLKATETSSGRIVAGAYWGLHVLEDASTKRTSDESPESNATSEHAPGLMSRLAAEGKAFREKHFPYQSYLSEWSPSGGPEQHELQVSLSGSQVCTCWSQRRSGHGKVLGACL